MKGYRLKRTAGFSLLELMVVVAIIGVLAAVAVPRFNIFRARARQAEAKSNLGVIFTLQEAFKIDKEKYYDGVAATWGGAGMKKLQAVGYRSGGTPTNVCPANKLGFRLANCDSARYKYWIREADEHSYLTVAWAASDVTAKRIFPGCKGSNTTVVQPAHSKSGSKKCQKTTVNTAGVASHADSTIAALTAAETGGDAFCLDHQRTVDNFRDIVGDAQCVN